MGLNYMKNHEIQKLRREMEWAEKAMEEEDNLEQISFYEGYIRGLKYLIAN